MRETGQSMRANPALPLARRPVILKPAAAAAGVPWASWQTLRHTCGSLLFRHGANAEQVQVWLGHHSPAFTLAVYVHLLDDDAPDASFFDAITSRSEGTRVATSVATRPDLRIKSQLPSTRLALVRHV